MLIDVLMLIELVSVLLVFVFSFALPIVLMFCCLHYKRFASDNVSRLFSNFEFNKKNKNKNNETEDFSYV